MEETIKGLGQIAWWLPPLIVALPFAWVMLRSGSTFALRHRFWRLTRPEKSIENDDIRNAVKERADLIAFRALLMRADTLGETKRIIAWANANEIDVGTVGDCQRYFHRQDLKLKASIPDLAKTKFFSIAIYYILAVIAVIGLDLALQSGVLLSFKDDHTLFFLSTKSAQLFREQGGIAVLVPGDCPKPDGWAGFSKQHAASICSAFKSAGLSEQLDAGLRFQRWFALAILASALLGFLKRSRRVLAIRSAHAVRSWLALREKVALSTDKTGTDPAV
jgi:hypothetical protein